VNYHWSRVNYHRGAVNVLASQSREVPHPATGTEHLSIGTGLGAYEWRLRRVPFSATPICRKAPPGVGSAAVQHGLDTMLIMRHLVGHCVRDQWLRLCADVAAEPHRGAQHYRLWSGCRRQGSRRRRLVQRSKRQRGRLAHAILSGRERECPRSSRLRVDDVRWDDPVAGDDHLHGDAGVIGLAVAVEATGYALEGPLAHAMGFAGL
jgi:hypothetical protein